MNTLENLGFGPELAADFESVATAGAVPARIVAQHRGGYVIQLEAGTSKAQARGVLAMDPDRLPAVGDWVVARIAAPDFCLVEDVLPRHSVFQRRAPGAAARPQTIAANVDVVFVVCGLDGDFNPRRINRYLTPIQACGARPVVVLNKADLSTDLEAQRKAVTWPDVAVISAHDGTGVEALQRYLGPGITVALVGMSGVGKSTLVNCLLGEERMATGGIREDDAKGRHTTTHRELVPLPSGGALIDTPGMRELQLWNGEDGLDDVFAEIAAFAEHCGFRDCQHQGEPDCAVQAAIDSGELDADILAQRHKLEGELAREAAKRDAYARHLNNKARRSFSKEIKLRQRLRGR